MCSKRLLDFFAHIVVFYSVTKPVSPYLDRTQLPQGNGDSHLGISPIYIFLTNMIPKPEHSTWLVCGLVSIFPKASKETCILTLFFALGGDVVLC